MWYARKDVPESNPILELKLNVQGDLQQRWNAAVATFTSTEPFQFVFLGQLADNVTALAIDDITYEPNCSPSDVRREPNTTTVQTITTSDALETTLPTTKSPLNIKKPSNRALGMSH